MRRSRRHQKMEQCENAERAEIIAEPPKGIMHRHTLKNVTFSNEFETVKVGDIVRVHDSNYIGDIMRRCEDLDEHDLENYDGDTNISKHTWEASVKAAGACIKACTQVMEKSSKNAF